MDSDHDATLIKFETDVYDVYFDGETIGLEIVTEAMKSKSHDGILALNYLS